MGLVTAPTRPFPTPDMIPVTFDPDVLGRLESWGCIMLCRGWSAIPAIAPRNTTGFGIEYLLSLKSYTSYGPSKI